MKLEREIWLEGHAYERYCQRVEPIGWRELESKILTQIREGFRQQDGYVHIGGVWWRGKVTHSAVRLYTCYGKSHLDMPGAVRWANRMRDRIRL